MRILVDENIPRMTVDVLRGLGNDVKDIRGTRTQELPDSELWRLAVTYDQDSMVRNDAESAESFVRRDRNARFLTRP
jgi:predicted nuclease of predicted toxin-antitoxin system